MTIWDYISAYVFAITVAFFCVLGALTIGGIVTAIVLLVIGGLS